MLDTATPAGAPAAGESTELSRRYLALEVLAVLSITGFPSMVGSFCSYFADGPRVRRVSTDHFAETLVFSFFEFVPILFIMGCSGSRWKTFGIVRPRLKDLALSVLAIFATFGTIFLVPLNLLLLGGEGARTPPLRPPGQVTPLTMVLLPLAAIVTGVIEELGMRAYLIPRLEKLLGGTARAVLASSIVFATCHVHQGPLGVLGAFEVGVIYGALFAAQRRIWPLVVAHAFHDGLIWFVASTR